MLLALLSISGVSHMSRKPVSVSDHSKWHDAIFPWTRDWFSLLLTPYQTPSAGPQLHVSRGFLWLHAVTFLLPIRSWQDSIHSRGIPLLCCGELIATGFGVRVRHARALPVSSHGELPLIKGNFIASLKPNLQPTSYPGMPHPPEQANNWDWKYNGEGQRLGCWHLVLSPISHFCPCQVGEGNLIMIGVREVCPDRQWNKQANHDQVVITEMTVPSIWTRAASMVSCLQTHITTPKRFVLTITLGSPRVSEEMRNYGVCDIGGW